MTILRPVALLVASLFVFAVSTVHGRELLQDATMDGQSAGGSLQSIDVNFANTYASDSQNKVTQEVSLFIPQPAEELERPTWVRDVIPQRIDPDNPICTLGDRKVYKLQKGTTQPIRDTVLTTVAFYVPVEQDIRAEVRVSMVGENGTGYAEVTGPAIYGRSEVSNSKRDKRICGNWAWSSFGYYSFEVRALGAQVMIDYYTREHTPGRSASFEEFPLTFNLKVHTTVAGNGVNVVTDTALQSKYVDGKIIVVLNNDIVGDNNTASQTARARVDGAVAQDEGYIY